MGDRLTGWLARLLLAPLRELPSSSGRDVLQNVEHVGPWMAVAAAAARVMANKSVMKLVGYSSLLHQIVVACRGHIIVIRFISAIVCGGPGHTPRGGAERTLCVIK